MGDFFSSRSVKAVRRARRCDECGHMIEVGQPADHYAASFEGDFYTGSVHPDCAKWAARAINPDYDGKRPFMNEIDPEWDSLNIDWIDANPPPPEVRARMSSVWDSTLQPKAPS